MQEAIRKAGFTDVQEQSYKWPIGPWARDQKYKEAGIVNFQHWLSGMEGWCMWLLTKFGTPEPWSKEVSTLDETCFLSDEHPLTYFSRTFRSTTLSCALSSRTRNSTSIKGRKFLLSDDQMSNSSDFSFFAGDACGRVSLCQMNSKARPPRKRSSSSMTECFTPPCELNKEFH
jgi:hypothetical protein